MRKCVEAGFSVVGAHPAGTDSPKGQKMGYKKIQKMNIFNNIDFLQQLTSLRAFHFSH